MLPKHPVTHAVRELISSNPFDNDPASKPLLVLMTTALCSFAESTCTCTSAAHFIVACSSSGKTKTSTSCTLIMQASAAAGDDEGSGRAKEQDLRSAGSSTLVVTASPSVC